jgi:OmpA-OmpF porin, OOP family
MRLNDRAAFFGNEMNYEVQPLIWIHFCSVYSMKSLTLSLFLCLFALSLYAQKLEPTAQAALLITTVKNMSGDPRPNEIVIYVNQSNQKAYKGVTDAKGQFELLVPKGHKYTIKYKILNEWRDNNQLEIPDGTSLFTQEVELSFDYSVSKPITFQNVHFDSGKSILRPESYKELDELLEVLKLRKKMRIRINGHTDNVGADATNQALSQKRAEAIKAYLVSKGITVSRIESKGFGSTQPVADNNTDEGRQKNRRTEVEVLSGYND